MTFLEKEFPCPPSEAERRRTGRGAVRLLPEGKPNCLVSPAGWNYSVRQYRPRQAIIDGIRKFSEAQPVK
jgi:hypothetical protein